MIETRLSNKGKPSLLIENDLVYLKNLVSYFSKRVTESLKNWRKKFDQIKQNNHKVIIWGGGSKGVAFLTTLQIYEEIQFVVDINPYKHGTYIAGTGQEIVAPEFLKEYKPDVVIVMNPIYCDEIRRDLRTLNQTPELIAV